MLLYRRDKSLKGFTIVELLIVIVIISTLASVALVRYRGVIERARASKAGITIFDIANAEKRYFLEEDNYTAALTDLDIYESDPSNADADFTYSFADPWAIANKASSGGGRLSYRLSLTGTRESTDGTY